MCSSQIGSAAIRGRDVRRIATRTRIKAQYKNLIDFLRAGRRFFGMNLDFSDDQKALQAQVRRFLSEKCRPEAVRSILEGPEPYDRALYAGLADLGVLGVAIPEAYGGMGLGRLELCLIAEELGRVLAPVPVSSSIYLCAEALLLAGTEAQKSAWLPKLACGGAIGTLAMAERPGRVGPETIKSTYSSGKLSGEKAIVPDGDAADVAVVLARAAGGLQLCVVDLTGPGVRRETLETIDPTRSYAKVTFKGARAEPLGAPGDGWGLCERVLDRAAILMAYEQLGGADRALDMARDYALDRMAFGRPIGSFQAVKHENMSPGEIEDVLREHPGVADVAVLGLPDNEWGEKVAAVVVAAEAKPSADDLAAFVKSRLRSSKTPQVWEFRDALPYNDTGKLLRRQLKGEMTPSHK